ncbi:hypothetical protein LKC85_004648 [Salmonella enterica]|nr:hypothetical protein [Salmonella enterica]
MIGTVGSTHGQFEGMRSKEAHSTATALFEKYHGKYRTFDEIGKERMKEAVSCLAIVKHRKEGQSAEQVLEEYIDWLHG